MRIGVNTLFYIPGQVGGSETYLLEILRVWKRSGAVPFLTLFTQRENHARLHDEFAGEGWDCDFLDFAAESRVARILREQVQLPGRVRRAGVDVLWSPGYTSPWCAPCPQAVSLLDMQYKSFPEDLSFVARWTTEALIQPAARFADAILTISEFSKSEILRHTRAAPERVHVTLLAAAPEFSAAQGEVVPPSRPYLLCVANTYPHKNVDQLVRAFALLEDKIPHDLVIVGRPRLGEARFSAAIQKLRHPERVIRRAGVDRAELASLYRNADLFVFPSLYEGFGLPVLEAMGAGALVLSTRCGSIPEVGGDVIDSYDADSEDDLADSILRCLAKTPEEKARQRARAMERAATFRWESCAEKTLEVLQSL